jgi:hypothetical protein
MPATFAPQYQPRPVGSDDDSPLVVWLSVIGGGLALLLVIGMIVYNATRRPAPQVATTATSAANQPVTEPTGSAAPAPPASEPSATMPAVVENTPTPQPQSSAGATAPPAAPQQPAATAPPQAVASPTPPLAGIPVAPQIPVATQVPAAAPPAAAEESPFTPPDYGGMVTSPDGKYEVWLPSAPQKFDPALDLAAFLPKPKEAKALIAFGKQGPTEICAVSFTSGATAGAIFAEMERAFPGEPDSKTIKFAGVDARQYDFFIEITEGKFAIRTIAFVLDGNGYTLQSLSITGQKETDETRAFFASFRKKKTGGK